MEGGLDYDRGLDEVGQNTLKAEAHGNRGRGDLLTQVTGGRPGLLGNNVDPAASAVHQVSLLLSAPPHTQTSSQPPGRLVRAVVPQHRPAHSACAWQLHPAWQLRSTGKQPLPLHSNSQRLAHKACGPLWPASPAGPAQPRASAVEQVGFCSPPPTSRQPAHVPPATISAPPHCVICAIRDIPPRPPPSPRWPADLLNLHMRSWPPLAPVRVSTDTCALHADSWRRLWHSAHWCCGWRGAHHWRPPPWPHLWHSPQWHCFPG